jgi:hypothetical protein
MSDRTFTFDEAQSLLPVLESLLRVAMNAKRQSRNSKPNCRRFSTASF